MSESIEAELRTLRPPEESPDDAPRDPAPTSSKPRRRGSRRHRTWLEGGTSVQFWGWELLGWAVLGLGAGLVAAAALNEFAPQPLGSTLSLLVVWVAFLAPVVFAFARSRPRALLRFRPLDLLYGIALGLILRLVQGWLEMAAGGSSAWPAYSSGGALPSNWWFDQLLAGVIVAPVLEELFFRGLVLVAVYTAVRRLAGAGIATFAAALVSTGLFVVAHALLAPVTWDAAVSLALVGLINSLIVLLTGRIWGAVLAHAVYNGIWIALATVGTLLGGTSPGGTPTLG
ncbi:CPBP family intramembrane glutamic endopeptidase [Microbacterium sp. 10M-3C3]|jgi:membrane protease YdiL (CAAX protease family)|uniref:CPBP family intramembrane glutamic endopeptidase n=1 Tax=Microbacterium sp. 10M-3C3 TaxID=2483401 RepID=UPI0013DE714B|nr:CPBP family intramembrane glutamic endopeptidase [Microbacterium sp. 10M-3C3]